MNETQRFLLLHHRKPISLDLRAEDAFSYMQSKFVLDVDDIDIIQSERTSKRKANALLDVLLEKDGTAFHHFRGALRYAGYDHLAELLLPGVDPSFQQDAAGDDQDANIDADAILQDGGVPQRLKIFTPRPVLVQQLRQELYKLRGDNSFVVIHGMVGIGKTVLASEALRCKDLIRDCFPGGVFWVSVGLVDDAKLLVKMQTLCIWLEDSATSVLPRNLEEARLKIRLLFRKRHPRSLLVLDDVWSSGALKAFDVRVRTLVTTRDSSIAVGISSHVHKFHLSSGLGSDEAREVLAKYTGSHVDALPVEADSIIEETKGSPLALAMIGALLQQHSDRWVFYLKKLKQSRLTQIRSKIAYEYPTLHEAFVLSLETLPAGLIAKYIDFVIFNEGARIPKKVLATLWNEEEEDVEDAMDDLINKSLALCHPPSKDCAVKMYSIHDLQRDILIEKMNGSMDALMKLHLKLVDRYWEKCGGNFAQLPCDGYIHWHIIEHMVMAGKQGRAASLMTNLDFLDANLRVTGAPNVINSYKIVINGASAETSNELEMFCHFIRTNGDHFMLQAKFDITQLALWQPATSVVYQKAIEKAKTASKDSSLHMEWVNKSDVQLEDCPLVVNLGLGSVHSCQFSPDQDSTVAVSAGSKGIIKVWEFSSGAILHTFEGHTEMVVVCCFSPDGKRIVSCSTDKSIKIWSLVSPSHVMELIGHTEDVTCCQFSPDGSNILSSSFDGTVKVWDAHSGKVIHTMDYHDDNVNHCCYSADGNRIASASSDATIKVCSAEAGLLLLSCQGEHDFFSYCAFLLLGNKLLGASINYVEMFSAVDGSPLRTVITQSSLLSFDFSADGRLVVTGSADTTAKLWDLGLSVCLGTFDGHSGWVNDVSLAKDGTRMLTASADGLCKIWSVKPRPEAVSKLVQVFDAAWTESDNALTVTVATSSNTIKVFRGVNASLDVESKELSSGITSCHLVQDRVFVGTETGGVIMLDASAGTITGGVDLGDFTVDNVLAMTTAGPIAVLCADFVVRILAMSLETISCCRGHTEKVSKVVPLQCGIRMVTSSFDGSIKLWNSLTGECLLTCSDNSHSLTSCCVSQDERIALASSTDCSVKCWDLSTGSLSWTLDGFDDAVRCVACNGRYVAAGADNSIVIIWDISNREQVALCKAGSGWVSEVRFTAAGSLLVASDAVRWFRCDGTLMQTCHVRASLVRRVAVSHDSDVLVTVDDTGQLYVLRRIR